MIQDAIKLLVENKSLSENEMISAMRFIMEGNATGAQTLARRSALF
jgi:anthranilate phosphoribosyltransferase